MVSRILWLGRLVGIGLQEALPEHFAPVFGRVCSCVCAERVVLLEPDDL